MPENLRDRIAEALHSVTWPDGSTDDLPTRSVCRMLADALLPLVEQHGDERAAEVERRLQSRLAEVADVAEERGYNVQEQRDRAECAEAALREVRALLTASDHEPTNRVWHEQMQRLRTVLDREGSRS